MSPPPFEPYALRAHRLFESRDLDETRERISRVMQPHVLLPAGRLRGAAHMDYVRLGDLGLGTIAFGDAMHVQVDAVNGYYLLMFCLSGRAEVRAMGRLIDVDARTGVLCAPGDRFDALLSANCEQFVLRIDAAKIATLTSDAHGALDPVLRVDETALAAWRQQLMLVASSPALLERASSNLRVASQLEHLLIDLLIEGHPPATASASRRDPAPGFVRRAQEYVEAHYAHPVQLADIVRVAMVPERTLRDAFLRFRGMSPMQYLRLTRLEHARELLCSSASDKRIADVALDCGFTHLGRFAIAYREKFGELPSETLEKVR